LSRIRVTLKLATSLDGKIALSNGESGWVTGEVAREAGRRLRAQHDAICIGSNTALLDNPQLTTRMGDLPDPMRVVWDTRLRISPESNLAQTAKAIPTVVLTGNGSEKTAKPLKNLSVVVIAIPLEGEHVSITQGLDALERMGVETLLLEGGGQLAAAFLKAGCVDVLEWFTAPIIIGGDGRDCIAALELSSMADVHGFERVSLKELGPDIHQRFEKAH